MPPRRRNVPFACRSLAIFVQSLEGGRVVVELRNDTIVRGVLDTADDFMNLTMSEVSYEPLQAPRQRLPFLFLKARHVRFIHLPATLDPERSVTEYRRKQHAAARASIHAHGMMPKGVHGSDAELPTDPGGAPTPESTPSAPS